MTTPEGTVMNSLIVSGNKAVVADSGESGGMLWEFSTDKGQKVNETPLPAIPEFDGLAIANGELFFTSIDGSLFCLSGE